MLRHPTHNHLRSWIHETRRCDSNQPPTKQTRTTTPSKLCIAHLKPSKHSLRSSGRISSPKRRTRVIISCQGLGIIVIHDQKCKHTATPWTSSNRSHPTTSLNTRTFLTPGQQQWDPIVVTFSQHSTTATNSCVPSVPRSMVAP